MRWAALALAAYAVLPFLLGRDLAVVVLGPLAPEYFAEQVPWLAQVTAWDLSHRIGGAALLVLGLGQLRWRGRDAHRRRGWTFAALALSSALGGSWMALSAPFSEREVAPALTFAALLVACVGLGLRHVRRDIPAHRRWMERALALCVGPLTVRVAHVALCHLFELDERAAMGPAFWLGWPVPLLALEIRRRLR